MIFDIVKNAEIFIYDVIGYDWWTGGGITAQSFIRELNALLNDKDVKDITVRINSPGGSIVDGIAIYNAIIRATKDVHTIIDGIAWSMGGVIALAGKTVKMANNATILIHNASGWASGNAKDLDASSEMLKAIDTGLANSIADKTGLTVEEVQAKWFDYADHTLTAAEARDAKLVDEVTSSKADIPKDIANWSKDKIFNYFYAKHDAGKKDGVLDQIKNWFSKQPSNSIAPKAEEPPTITNNEEMTIKDFDSIKGLTADKVTADHIKAITDRLKAEGIEGIEIAAAGTLAQLQAKVAEKKPETTETTETTDKVDLVDLKAQAESILAKIADLEEPADPTNLKGTDTQHEDKKDFKPVVKK